MKNLRFIHLGDLQFDSDNIRVDKITASLDEVVSYCEEIKVNAIIIPGDIWEKPQVDPMYDSPKGKGVEQARKYLNLLADLVDFIFITKGNNTHDPVGSIKKLHQLEPNIYAYEQPVWVLQLYRMKL